MTYAEEKAFYLRDEVAVEDYEGAVNQIIADTTRAHVEIINAARHEGVVDLRSIRARIEQAEVKGE